MYIKLTNAERLKDLRKERGLTLDQLAKETGLSKSALGSYSCLFKMTLSDISILAESHKSVRFLFSCTRGYFLLPY